MQEPSGDEVSLSSRAEEFQKGVELEENTIEQEIVECNGTIKAIRTPVIVYANKQIRNITEKRLEQDEPSSSSRAKILEEPVPSSLRSHLPAEFNETRNDSAAKPLHLSKKSVSSRKQSHIFSFGKQDYERENIQLVPETIDFTHLAEFPSLGENNGSTYEQDSKNYFHSIEIKRNETIECSDTIKSTRQHIHFKQKWIKEFNESESKKLQATDSFSSRKTQSKSKLSVGSDDIRIFSAENLSSRPSTSTNSSYDSSRKTEFCSRLPTDSDSVQVLTVDYLPSRYSTSIGESSSYDSRRMNEFESRLSADSDGTNLPIEDYLPSKDSTSLGEISSYDSGRMTEFQSWFPADSDSIHVSTVDYLPSRQSTSIGESSSHVSRRMTELEARLPADSDIIHVSTVDYLPSRHSTDIDKICCYDSSKTPGSDSRLSVDSDVTKVSTADYLPSRHSTTTGESCSYDSSRTSGLDSRLTDDSDSTNLFLSDMLSKPSTSPGTNSSYNSTTQFPFVCEHCGSAYRSKHELTSHARIHASKKHFDCESCSKSFSTKSKLKKHIKRKHTEQ